MLASTILEIMNGGPVRFYYDFGRTFGLTFGLASLPLISILGPTSLAFNLPATLFYSLYLWTTYLIARILIPRTAYLVFIMLIFTPFFLTEMTTHNWAHVPAAFLGNLIFLFFIKAKSCNKKNNVIIFFLFFCMGFAIYTYTYSLIFILTVGILYALTHPDWFKIREIILIKNLVSFFKNKKTKIEFARQLFDALIIIFFIAVLFSYIFGGFGLDIAGYSILQINKFNKAGIQFLVLIFIRILIDPKGSISFFHNAKSYCVSCIQLKTNRVGLVAASGFLFGLSPRIASILIGETSQGGQGHDVDFSPTKIFSHLLDLLTHHGPQLFGFDKSFKDLIFHPNGIYPVIVGILFLALIAIFCLSIFSIIFENRIFFKNLMFLKGMQLKEIYIFLLLPIIVCVANIIVQHGPETRYLFPLFGVLTLFVGIYTDKIKKKNKWFPLFILSIWIIFFSITNYRGFLNSQFVQGGKLVKLSNHKMHDVLNFLNSKNISTAYSNYSNAGKGTFWSGGKIIISDYSEDPPYKIARKARSMSNPYFAIIASGKRAIEYQNYLKEKSIGFKNSFVAGSEVFWDFTGREEEINKLRSIS